MLAWIHHALDDGLERYWNANVFYPHRRTLTYSESFLAPSLLCWPIHLLTGNLTLCYNLVVLSSFFLNGVAVYLLALRFRLPWRAAVASGMAFAFCPYLFHEIYNPIMLLTYPAVFLWVCLHRLLHRPSRLGVVLAGFCSLWLLTTSYQYTLFCAVFCGIWLVWFARRIPWRRLWLPACVTGIVVLAAAWLWLAPVRQTHGEMGLQQARRFPLNWNEFLLPAVGQRLYYDVLGLRLRDPDKVLTEDVCFPGLAVGILMLCGGWAAIRGAGGQDAQADSDRLHAWRFCVVVFVAGVVLAMGSTIDVGMETVPGPYALLSWAVPAFASVRSVYRLYAVAQVFGAILAGVGLAWLTRRTSKVLRWGAPAAIAGLFVAESIWLPFDLHDAPTDRSDRHPLYARMEEQDPNAPVIEVPVPRGSEEIALDAIYMLNTIHTWQPLVNGYASFTPGLYEQLRPLMKGFPSEISVACLRALGVHFVLVHTKYLPPEAVEAIRSCPHLEEVALHDSDVLYALRNTRSQRLSPQEWQGKRRLRVYRDPESETGFSIRLAYALARKDVIPVLPGDEGTRWQIRWLDASGQVRKTQDVWIPDSRWLTSVRNGFEVALSVPERPDKYTVQAVDHNSGNVLATCSVNRK